MNYPNILTIAFAAFAVLVVWLYLPRNKQVWLLSLTFLAVALFVNVWLEM